VGLSSRADRDAVGLGFAVGLYATAFGSAAVAAGLSVPQAVALSALAFTGGSQFAFVGVLASGGAVGAGVAGALLLGSRNALYAVALAPVLRRRRPLAAHLVIDESTAMALAQPDPGARRRAFWLTGASVWVFWNLFTLVGAAGADALGDPERLGLDAAVPAAFLALLAPRLRERSARPVAALAVVTAVALVPFVSPGVPVLAAGAVAVPWVVLRR
jgi:predicted branched-subunit amino acid permease